MIQLYLPLQKTHAIYGPKGFTSLPFEICGVDGAIIKITHTTVLHGMNLYVCEITGEITANLKSVIMLLSTLGHRGIMWDRSEWSYFNDAGNLEGPFSQHRLMGWKQYLTNRNLEILHEEIGILLDYDILISLLPEPKSQENKQFNTTQTNYHIENSHVYDVPTTGHLQQQQQQQQHNLEQKSHNSLSISNNNNNANVYHSTPEIQQQPNYNYSIPIQNENVNDLSNKLMESQITHDTNLSASASNQVNKSHSASSINIKSIVPETKSKKWNFTTHSSSSSSQFKKSHLEVISQHNLNNINQVVAPSSPNQNQARYDNFYNHPNSNTNLNNGENYSPSTAMSQVSGQEVISRFQPFINDNSNDESVFRNEELVASSVSDVKRDNFQYVYEGSDNAGDGDAHDSSIVAPTIDNSLPTVDDIQSVSIHNGSSQQFYSADSGNFQQQPQQPSQQQSQNQSQYNNTQQYSQQQQHQNQNQNQQQNEYENEMDYDYNQNYDVYGYNNNNNREDRNWKNYDPYRQNNYRRNSYNRRNTGNASVSAYNHSNNGYNYSRKEPPNYPSTSREIFGNCHAKNRNILPSISFDENTNVILESLSKSGRASFNNSMWSRNFERGCSILEKAMCDVLQYILQNVIGDMWSYITAKLPWSCKDMLVVMHKHWESNFRGHFPHVVRSYREEVENAIRLFKQNNLTVEICFRTIVVMRDMLYSFELQEIQNSELNNVSGFGNNSPVITYRQAYASLQKGREEAQALYEDCVNHLRSTIKNLSNMNYDNRHNNYERRRNNYDNRQNYNSNRKNYNNTYNRNYNTNTGYDNTYDNYNTNTGYDNTYDNYNTGYDNTYDNYNTGYDNANDNYNTNTGYDNANENYNTTGYDNANENYSDRAYPDYYQNINSSDVQQRQQAVSQNIPENNSSNNVASISSPPSVEPYSQSSASVTQQQQQQQQQQSQSQKFNTGNQQMTPPPVQNYHRSKTLHSAPSLVSVGSNDVSSPLSAPVQSYSESKLNTNLKIKTPNIKNINLNNNAIQEKSKQKEQLPLPSSSGNRMGLQVDLIWIRQETEKVKWKSMSAEHLLEFVRDMVSVVTLKAIKMKNVIVNDMKKIKGIEKITNRIKNIIKALKIIETKLHSKNLEHADIQNMFNALKDLITEIHVEAFRFCRKLQMPDDKYIDEFKSVVENWFEEDPTKFERVVGLFEDIDSKLGEIIKESGL